MCPIYPLLNHNYCILLTQMSDRLALVQITHLTRLIEMYFKGLTITPTDPYYFFHLIIHYWVLLVSAPDVLQPPPPSPRDASLHSAASGRSGLNWEREIDGEDLERIWRGGKRAPGEGAEERLVYFVLGRSHCDLWVTTRIPCNSCDLCIPGPISCAMRFIHNAR